MLERDGDLADFPATHVRHGGHVVGRTVDVHWLGATPSWVHWRKLGDAEAIHGHDGATRFAWIDK